MSTYKIEVSFTPCCTACGQELGPMLAMSDPTRARGPFDKDNPYERTTQRVLVPACEKCFVFARDADELKAALAALTTPKDPV